MRSQSEIGGQKTYRTHNGRLPLERVVACRTCAARRGWVTAEVNQFLLRTSCQHHRRMHSLDMVWAPHHRIDAVARRGRATEKNTNHTLLMRFRAIVRELERNREGRS